MLDVTYQYGTTGNVLNWTVESQFNNPNYSLSSYTVLENDSSYTTGTWTSSVPINVSIDGLDPGEYNFTLIVSDDYSLTNTSTILVTVYATAPTINSPADFNYTVGTTGHSIVWNALDNNPNSYYIYIDEVQVDSGSWSASYSISVNVDGLSAGKHNVTIEVTNQVGLATTDTVIVTVISYTTTTTTTTQTTGTTTTKSTSTNQSEASSSSPSTSSNNKSNASPGFELITFILTMGLLITCKRRLKD